MGFTGKRELARLERRRQEVVAGLASMGEFTPGSVAPTWRKCGKSSCHCAGEGDRGHGPRWLWNWQEGGRTRTAQVPPGQVAVFEEGTAAWRRFKAQAEELAEVNAAIARVRLEPGGPAWNPGPAGEKGGPKAKTTTP